MGAIADDMDDAGGEYDENGLLEILCIESRRLDAMLNRALLFFTAVFFVCPYAVDVDPFMPLITM